MNTQVIPIPFGSGIDSKTDPKAVGGGKLLRLENATFIQAKQVAKRNGYQALSLSIQGGGSITNPQLIKSYKSELVCAAGGRFYSYSPTQSAWVDKGKYAPVSVRSSVISKEATAQHTLTSGASIGNLAVYAWEQGYQQQVQPWACAFDLSTNTQILAPKSLSSTPPQDGSGHYTSSSPKVCALGSSGIGVFYRNVSGSLCVRILPVGGSAFGAEIVLVTTCQLYDNGDPFISGTVFPAAQYSVQPTPAGAVLAISTTSGVQLKSISTAGAVTGSVTVSTTTNVTSIAAAYDSVGTQTFVYWCDASGALPDLKYAVYSGALSQILAPTSSGQTPPVGPMTAIRSGTNTQILIYAGAPGISGSFYQNKRVYRLTCTTSGAVSAVQIGTNLNLQSELFSVNGANFFAAVNYSKPQPTLFVLDAADGVVVARSFSGLASDYRRGSYLSAPLFLSAMKYQVVASTTDELVASVSGLTSVLGASAVTLDFNDPENFQALEANGVLLLNGGLVSVYDGEQVSEVGFHLYPDNVSAVSLNPAIQPTPYIGVMADGTYTYFITYRWTDSQGNIYESAPSAGTAVTVSNSGANNGCVSITVDVLSLTSKIPPGSQVEFRIYRAKGNGSGQIAYDINGNSIGAGWTPILNNASGLWLNIIDYAADAAISKNGQLYTDGGVIENISPPPALAMTLHNNRVWLIDSENRNQLWYSKTLTPGAGINFSDLLTVQVNAIGGQGVALASMDDKLVILEERLPLVMAGDGANDAGTGSTLYPPQPIPADAGCATSKGVAVIPQGVLFKTPGKGIFIMDRSLGVRYFGAEVEKFNAQSVVSSLIMPTVSQVRFLTDSGLTLVYDYVFNQWSTFTNHQGHSADVWAGQYVYARTDGRIFQESPGYFLDASTPYSLLAQTGWLALGSIQGFQRVRRAGVLGTYSNGAGAGHAIQVQAAYDFSATFQAAVAYTFGGAGSAGLVQYRERLPIQKCDSLSLLIQEITTGDPLETVTLTDLSLEAGVKGGINRQSASKSVG